MSQWLLSITGVVLIGVLAELLLTDSPISRFVRSIYAFFILFVVVQPLPQFLRLTAGAVSGEVSLPLNTDLMETISIQTAAAAERRIVGMLESAGFEDVIVIIGNDKSANAWRVDRVFVNALGARITKQGADIDMKNEIINIVCASAGVSESKVFYAG